MHELRLDWKEFNIDMNLVEVWLKANAGDSYKGNSADSCLHLWFDEEPSEEISDSVQSYWDGLAEDSDEASAYKTADQIQSDKAAKKASGKSKLLGLGLSEDEVNALLG